MRVYIDTNIYLEFYRLATDDLDELKKFVELARIDKLTLYAHQQLRDELLRNVTRSSRIRSQR